MIWLLGLFALGFVAWLICISIIDEKYQARSRELRDTIWTVTPGSVERVDSFTYRVEVKCGRLARFVQGYSVFRFAETGAVCSESLSAACHAAVKDFLGSHT